MIRSSRRTSVGILAALAGLTLASTTSAATPGFYVQGRHLYDRCGEQVVLRGVNEMVVWSANQDGTPFFSEIARTGANVVRIAWTTDGSVSNLERAITNALGVDLIPMPELHDATGELSGVSACVDWWVRNDVVQMIQRYEERMVLNIANEAGDDAVTEQQFVSTYSSAITRMRNAGINVPLIIDASSWGQDIDMLQAAGPALVDADPDGNVMFSVHMWWGDPAGDRVRTELQQSADEGLPLIVGEFALSAFSGCGDNPFAYRVLLSEAERLQIGWLAWSWGGVDNADCAPTFDMTTNGTFGSWENAWGEEVAVTDANSI
jgi:mannan endo-1,4-beta-mannosidase